MTAPESRGDGPADRKQNDEQQTATQALGMRQAAIEEQEGQRDRADRDQRWQTEPEAEAVGAKPGCVQGHGSPETGPKRPRVL